MNREAFRRAARFVVGCAALVVAVLLVRGIIRALVPVAAHQDSLSVQTASAYQLDADKVLVHIAHPRSEDRMALFRELGREVPGALASVTVERGISGDRPKVGLVYGPAILPRKLDAVLEYSLGISVREMENLPLASEIALPGDWVVRKGTPREKLLEELERIVERETRQRIHFDVQDREREVLLMKGAFRTDGKPLEILFAEGEGSLSGGTIGSFADALSIAMGVPIEPVDPPAGLSLSWHNNSDRLRAEGKPITEQMRMDALNQIAERMSVTFEHRLVKRPVVVISKN